MMPSRILNKILIILLIVSMTFIGCYVRSNSTTNQANSIPLDNVGLQKQIENIEASAEQAADASINNPNIEYSISFKNSSYFYVPNSLPLEKFYWSDELSFNIIQIKDVNDSLFIGERNTIIADAMTSWIGGKVVGASSVSMEIFCHSDRYLSFVNIFEYQSNRLDYIKDYITIDMVTGKRVMLDDLIQINEDFTTILQNGNIARKSEMSVLFENDDNISESLKRLEPEELMTKLNECSFTQEQIIKKGYTSIEETIGSLIFRNSFYVKDNQLIIVLYSGGELHVKLCLDDIMDFLKVKKW